MDRQSETGTENSGLNGKGASPMLETRRMMQTKIYPRRPSLLPLILLCLTVGLGTAFFMVSSKPPDTSQSIPESEAFRWAVNRAMSAAELTQTAKSSEEWQQVVRWWQEAIELMQNVPESDSNHKLAVEKIAEYQKNLQYAQGELPDASSQLRSAEDLWGVGSRRAMVLKVQGNPSEIYRYDSMCKEILHYDKSTVELNNGIVSQYEDFDRKLKVAKADAPLVTSRDSSWDLGSTKDDVFRLQGTPNRTTQFEYSDRETLYYGNSTVDLNKQRVIGYNNLENNLRVRVVPTLVNASNSSSWSLASSREELLRLQGTPQQVELDNPACTETFHYGDSTVRLKNGFIADYNNAAGNLRVKAN